MCALQCRTGSAAASSVPPPARLVRAACGSLEASPSYSEDDRAFALRAVERTPVELVEARSALPAGMAFPMFDQLGLAGCLLAGLPLGGAHYPPDEIDNLGWATQQVGQALQARELRAKVATPREQLAQRSPRRRTKSPSLTALPGAVAS
jgi:hypothetical protein